MILQNDRLTVKINALGGELHSIRGADGTEYLWPGHPGYWMGQALNLFPFVGRLQGGAYLYRGKTYQLGTHGFVRHTVLSESKRSDVEGELFMEDSAQTLAQYPFRFRYSICYRLEGAALHVVYRVENKDDKILPFGIGGHPGFCVPMEKGLKFTDYRVRFPEAKDAKQVVLSDACLIPGQTADYDLGQEQAVALRHDLFDHDAIVLQNSGARAILERKDGKGRFVELSYPDCPYLGIWHAVRTDAPFVCLEPWATLPGREGVTEDFETSPMVLRLDPGAVYENRLCIRIGEATA